MPATKQESRRFVRCSTPDRSGRYAAWWPRSRTLSDELAALFEQWPLDTGRIAWVLYSAGDWDDHPASVAVPGRRVKTDPVPSGGPRRLVLTMLDGRRLAVGLIAPDTPADHAMALLDDVAARRKPPVVAPLAHPDPERDDLRCVWDNEGGHV